VARGLQAATERESGLMPPQFDALIYAASIWVIPLIIAITFHEAAHGYVARFFGDNTAWQFGRVTLNPFKHIDPVGTVLLPALLFISRSPFLFGYAKPVPVNFGALRNPRRDMVWVAAAGPGMNIALAVIAALEPCSASLVRQYLIEGLELFAVHRARNS
jgi:Zn-dependent protease